MNFEVVYDIRQAEDKCHINRFILIEMVYKPLNTMKNAQREAQLHYHLFKLFLVLLIK